MSGPCPAAVDGPARVRRTVEVAAGFFLTRLEVQEAALETRPGQFLQLRPRPADGFSPYLRTPLSVAAVDRAGGTVDVIYDLIGPKTRALSRWPADGTIGCLGPLGNSFPEPGREETAVLVGGGIGLPPLLFLGRQLREGGLTPSLLAGARSAARHLPDDLLRPSARTFLRATDDGTLGHRGPVTDLLLQCLDASGPRPRVYTCGPHPMMAAVARLCEERGVVCHASLEEYMACGFGVCVGCVVGRAEKGLDPYHRYTRVCVDGPVYDARTIEW